MHVEFFIVAWDDTTRGFFSAMERAVARGVTVRLLADHLPSAKIAGSKETFAELDRIGVKWSWMLPVQIFKGKYQRPDLRNHRKLVVVDGRVAFMGSQNLIARTYDSPKNIKRGLQWQELMTRLTGPVVAAVNAVFLSDWLIETGEQPHRPCAGRASSSLDTAPDALLCQVVPSGPGYPTENNLRMFLSLIYGATERVIITSPYFVPDEAMVYAITTACQRGLEVQLFVSEQADQWLVGHAQRSYYSDLLEAGVRIFMYPAPYILHAKHMSIDDDIAFIGSSNMDIRSFSLNAESSLLVRGRVVRPRDARGRAGLSGCRPRADARGVAQRAGESDVLRRDSHGSPRRSTELRKSPPPHDAARAAPMRMDPSSAAISPPPKEKAVNVNIWEFFVWIFWVYVADRVHLDLHHHHHRHLP